MPTLTLNKTVFEQLVGKKLSLEELKDRISMLGTDLEKIEGDQIHVEIFPNRPDMLSEQGFARAFSSFIGVKTGLRKYSVHKSKYKVIIDDSVKNIRPYTVCAVVKNIILDEEKVREIIQIQEKLHVTYGRNRKKVALGIYPLNKITFPVRYKAELPSKIKFRPLGMDQLMTAEQILSEHKMGQQYGHLLQGLSKYPYFIDANQEILSLPPIINSNLTGRVTTENTELFIECSGFDFLVLSRCLNMIVTALNEMGGEIYSVQLEYSSGLKTTPDLEPQPMPFNLEYVNKRIGLNLSSQEAGELLEKMGFGYSAGKVLVPAYRTDILHPVDLVEDIAIAYGYENLKAEIPNFSTAGREDDLEKFLTKIREVMVGLGLLETKNYHLNSAENLNQKMNLNLELIPLLNAVGEHNQLRNSLLPSLIKVLSENQHHEYPQKLVEIGRVFSIDQESKDKESKIDTGIKESEHLGIVLSHDKTDFTEIRQVLEALFYLLQLPVSVKEIDHPSFIPGRVGEVIISGEKIGIIGEFHPAVLEHWQLKVPTVGAELDLEKVWRLVRPKK